MEAGKRVEMVIGFLMVVTLGMHPITAHLPAPRAGTCIQRCLKECKLSGVGVAACIKYCPIHCLPPDASAKEHYCNLGCMLDQCAKFTDDETKMSNCVFDCRKYHCKITL